MDDLLKSNVTRIVMEDTNQFVSATKGLSDAAKGVVSGIDDIGSGISDIRSDIKSISKKASVAAGQYGAKSIIGKAAQNLFEFPVFVSSSVSMPYATAVNSLLEQMYASYLQMAISMNPVVNEKDIDANNAFARLKTNTSKYLEFATEFYQIDACGHTIIRDDCVFEFQMLTLPSDQLTVITEAFDYQPLSEFDHYFQEADKTMDYAKDKALTMLDEAREKHNVQQDAVRKASAALRKAENDPNVTDAEYEKLKADLEEAEQKLASATRDLSSRIRDVQNIEKTLNDREKAALDKARDEREKREESREQQRHRAEEKRKRAEEIRKDAQEARAKRKEQRDIARDEREKTSTELKDKLTKAQTTETNIRAISNKKVKAAQILDETKIQKLNTLKPLMMSVGVRVKNASGALTDLVDYVIGVRTHCRLVKAEILPEVVEYPTKANNLMSRRAKWRAGEIRFIDYLFSRKDKKQAAYDSKDPNRKWYHRLYTLAHSKGSKMIGSAVTGGHSAKEGLIPNCTIVMSQSDVINIETQTGIDLMKPGVAKRFCNELFLIALVVVDTDSESVKILLPDINNDYEVQSIAAVEKQREILDTSNTVSREVNKMMRGR